MRRFVGIDLASRAENTGWASISVDGGAVEVLAGRGADDDQIITLVHGAAKVGIDAPFGWPQSFVELVRRQETEPVAQTPELSRLRFRKTDHHVRRLSGRWPLSVSTDLIGVVALRCTRLLGRIAVETSLSCAKDGSGNLAEVYPAAALRMWGMDRVRYKVDASQRALIVEDLIAALPPDVPLPRLAMEASDDVLDACLSALIARAAHRGFTVVPTSDQADAAALEGWIHLPVDGSAPW